MIKKLLLTLAFVGLSGSIQGMGAQKVAQAGRFSWAAIKASMPTWREAYKSGQQQGQAHYRQKSVKFRPLGAVLAGSIIGAAPIGLADAQKPLIEFTVENIDKHSEMKQDFAVFAAQNMVIPETARFVNDKVVKGIVHFIHTYPDQVPDLVKIAQKNGTKVPTDIQRALAVHDKTFTCISYLSPSSLGWNALLQTGFYTVIEGACVMPKVQAIDEGIIASGNPEFSPEYGDAWKIEAQNLGKQLGKNITRSVAVGMAQSIATDMINEKINDKKVSELAVRVATPLLKNAYNKEFTLRNNMQAVSRDILAFGIGELILHKTNVTKAIAIPAYKENSYNNLGYYGKTFAQWTLTNLGVPMVSSIIAGKVCDKAFGSPSQATVPVLSVEVGS